MTRENIEKIPVDPIFLYVFDADEFKLEEDFVIINPTYYDCRISLSPAVVIRLIQWLAQKRYITVNGELCLKVRNKKVYYHDAS
jgi:hypothetical protein